MLTAFADGRIFGASVGDGPTRVLALHGWGGDHRQMAAVVEGFDAIALDLPGFGATPPPEGVWGAEQYAEAVAPVLDEMTVPAVLAGFSFGGRVAVHLAAAFPEKVHSVVLIGAPLLREAPTGKPPLSFRVMKRLHGLGLVSSDRMEAERRKRGSADYRNATGVMRDVLVRVVHETYEAQLREIRCPVEMVWGEADTAAPLHLARKAAALCNAHVTVIPEASHFVPLEHPEVVREAISRVYR